MNGPKQERGSNVEVSTIIAQDNPEKLVDKAQKVAEGSTEVSTSQIRNVFGPVRRIALEWPETLQGEEDRKRAERAYRQVVLLRPKLKYLESRDRNLSKLAGVLDACILKIQEGQDLAEKRVRFGRFVDFFEAILAYHTEKAKGSKSK